MPGLNKRASNHSNLLAQPDWRISIIPIEFRYNLRMTKELIPRQFHDPINQMIAAIILNRVRFGNEVSIQQCVSFHFDLTSLNPSRTLFSVE